MTRAPAEGLERLRRTARGLLWGGLALLVLPLLAWLGTGAWEFVTAPGDGHLPGLLTAALVLYLAPVGAVLVLLALLAGAWTWWLGRSPE